MIDWNPKVLVFAGSLRTGSYNRKLAVAAAGALRGAGLEAAFADMRDYPMPLYDGDAEATEGLPAGAKGFKRLVSQYDALVIASPEYNGSFSALLKNTIDWISRPETGEKPLAVLRGKTAAILATSPGKGGGLRGLRQLRELLEMIGVTVIPTQLALAGAAEAFDAAGNLARPEDRAALARLAADLVAAATEKGRMAA